MERRKTRAVRVGPVTIGGDAPVSVQSMTKTRTDQVGPTLRQIEELAEAGCEIVRCAVPDRHGARALAQVVKDSPLPVVADIHFDHRLALRAIEAGAHGVRVNPGTISNEAGLREVFRNAAAAGIKVRIGMNSGSVRPRRGLEVKTHEGGPDVAALMVREALRSCEMAEAEGCRALVISLKASDVPTTLRAYRLLAEGIGDTIRVSMTGPPHPEVEAALRILEALGLREPVGPQIVSCPTCGRCRIDLVSLVREVSERLKGCRKDIQVAIMGCTVNGPGEAAEADVGIAGGRQFGYIFRKGRRTRRSPASELADALMAEIEKTA